MSMRVCSCSREQMHGDVMGPVTRDRQVPGLGEMGDLHEGGDAATVRHVGFWEGDAA